MHKEQFEAWASSQGWPLGRHFKDAEVYAHSGIQCAWMAWQAAQDIRQPYDGLTKLEMFAMAAMQGRAAVPGRVDVEYDCMLAVKYADALLAELGKTAGCEA